eukprot:scaffold259520_cov35-Tisochrysis_lutea.AAC.4
MTKVYPTQSSVPFLDFVSRTLRLGLRSHALLSHVAALQYACGRVEVSVQGSDSTGDLCASGVVPCRQ